MDNMELEEEHDDEQQQCYSESVQQEEEGMSDNLTLNNNNAGQNDFFENERRLLEVVSRQTHSKEEEENNVNDDFQSHSPCKIARHETPDLLSSEVNDPSCDSNVEENTLNKCNQPEFSPSSCLNLSLPTQGTSVVVSKDDIGNNYQEENKVDIADDKNGLNISGYTLMFPSTTRAGSISATPITNNNGQVQNIFVLNLPSGVNAVLADQPSETEENMLITNPGIEQGLEGVNNNTLSSPSSCTSSISSLSCTSSLTPHVACDMTTNNNHLLVNNHNEIIDPDDDGQIRKCPGIEPNRVKFLSQVTPDGYVFNSPVKQNLVHPNTRNPFSSSSLRNDEVLDHRSPNSTNLEMENWQKFTDGNKENSPTSILNGIQGFGPLANHIPVSSYVLDSNQVVMSDPTQFSHDPTVCTFATSSIGSQIPSTPHPKYGQMTFCHNGLISQPPMKKEDEKPCPLNYLQSLNGNYGTNVNRKTNSLLCLKSNLANIKENDPIRHLHNLNERKRRARITIACDFMRKLVPGLSDKTDKATVFEYAARYIHFLNAQVGKEYDANFLVKYCNY